MLLTFEVEGENVVEVNFDAEGRGLLIRALTELVAGDQAHLFTPSWGGDTLTDNFPNPDLSPVHKVTLQWVETVGADE